MRDAYVLRPREYSKPHSWRNAGFGLALLTLGTAPFFSQGSSCIRNMIEELADAAKNREEKSIARRLEDLGALVYHHEEDYRRAIARQKIVLGVTYSETPSAGYFAEALYRAGQNYPDIQIVLHPVENPQLSEVHWSMFIQGLQIEKGSERMQPGDIPTVERAMSTLFGYARGVVDQR